MTYEEYLKKQEEANQQALAEQSAKTNAAIGNALGSAAVAYNDMKAIATSGGMSDVQSEYQPITAEDIRQTPPPVYSKPEKGHYNADEDQVVTNQQPLPQISDASRAKINSGSSAQVAQETIPDRPNNNAVETASEDEVVDEPTAYEKLKKAEVAEEAAARKAAEEKAAINNEREKTFAQLILDEKARQEAEKEEMRRQEQANTMSSMATNATEVASGLINMFSVGGLHASNQQYNQPRDWMQKADQDIKAHRARQRDMRATLDRLKLQQEQVRTSGRIEEMQEAQRRARAETERARREYEEELSRKKEEERKKKVVADMYRQGMIPDGSDGWVFSPEAWAETHPAKEKNSTVTYKSEKTYSGKTGKKEDKPKNGNRGVTDYSQYKVN